MTKTKSTNENDKISEDIKIRKISILPEIAVRENMTKQAFNNMLKRGVYEANNAKLYDADEVFDELIREL